MKSDTGAGPAADLDVRDLLNAQTGQIGWTELQKPFARGLLLIVAQELDLVEVAARVVENDSDAIQGWMNAGQLTRAETADARAWEQGQARFWAVVAAPWVLVQEIVKDVDGVQ